MIKDETTKNLIITIITSILFSIFGGLLLTKPYDVINIINIILISTTVVIGIVEIIRYIIRKDKEKKIDINLIFGIISLVLALVIFIFKDSIVNKAIYITIEVLLSIYVLSKFNFLKELKVQKDKNFGLSVFIIIIMLIINVIGLINPLKNILDNNKIVGIGIIFYSILDIILGLLFKANIK